MTETQYLSESSSFLKLHYPIFLWFASFFALLGAGVWIQITEHPPDPMLNPIYAGAVSGAAFLILLLCPFILWDRKNVQKYRGESLPVKQQEASYKSVNIVATNPLPGLNEQFISANTIVQMPPQIKAPQLEPTESEYPTKVNEQIPPQVKRAAFKSLVLGSKFKILLFVVWVTLLIATPLGMKMDYTPGVVQPSYVTIGFVIRNILFYAVIISIIRPEAYQKPTFIVAAVILGVVTTPFLTSILYFASIFSYILSQMLLVREILPAVLFFTEIPTSTRPGRPLRKVQRIVPLEILLFLGGMFALSVGVLEFRLIDGTTWILFWVFPVLLCLLFAIVFYILIRRRTTSIHTQLLRSFMAMLPLLFLMCAYMAYRILASGQIWHGEVTDIVIEPNAILEAFNAALFLILTMWDLYQKAPQAEQRKRYYSYVLWLYTLTLYNVWFDPLFEATGTFIVGLIFSAIGVIFLVQGLARTYAIMFNYPPKTKLRNLLFP